MLNWLKVRLRNYFYGKPITESYIGKVVQKEWTICYGTSDTTRYLVALFVVLKDDGCQNIAGPVLNSAGIFDSILYADDGLCYARKGSVTIVANSVAEYKEAQRVKVMAEKWRKSICKNEAGEIGIVTDYDGTTFRGKTLEGGEWESKTPKLLAETYSNYIA